MSWGRREAKSGKEGDENKEEEMRESGWRERERDAGGLEENKERRNKENE